MAARKAKPKKLTPEQARDRWHAAAVCLGYNELAKLGKTLAEKTYSRMARNAAEKAFMKLGGQRIFQEEPAVVTLVMDDGLPFINFREADIELMRDAVAKHDAARKGGARRG